MKRFTLLSLTLFMFVSILINFSPALAETVVIRMSHISGASAFEKGWLDWFCKEAETRTNGRVKVQVFWGGSLAKIKEQPQAVQSGLSDMGWIAAGYHSGYGQMAKILTLSSLFAPKMSPVEMMQKWLQLCDRVPEVYEEYEKTSMVPIVQRYYDRYWLFSNKPVRKLTDLKGMKVRTAVELHHTAYQAVDAVPIFLPTPEVYGALKKGVVDAVAFAIDTASRYKAYEVTKYAIQTDLVSEYAQWVMNLNTFKKLSWIDQKTMLQLGREASLLIAEKMTSFCDESIKLFKKAGLEIIKFPDEDKKAWAQKPAIEQYTNNWIKEAESKGLPGGKTVALYRKMMGN
ncbi:TRAP transporter substrate-binding protein [Thermodesulfobacteriota bacterium]